MHARRLPITLTLIALMLVTLIGGVFSVAAAAPATGQPSASAATAPAPKGAAVTPGNVYTWGLNDCGQIGDGTQETAFNCFGSDSEIASPARSKASAAEYNDRAVPIQVVNIGQVTDVSAGDKHNLAITVDKHVYAWGNDNFGQLGIGQTGGTYNYPVPVVAPCPSASPNPGPTPTAVPTVVPTPTRGAGSCGYLGDVTAVAGGYYHSLALTTSGTVFAWGSNGASELGNPGVFGSTDRPVPVLNAAGTAPLSGIVAIQAGNRFSLALTNDGHVLAWGLGGNGNLGNNSTNDQPLPVQVVGAGGGDFAGVIAIATDSYANFAYALKSDGTVWAWGYNGDGELGNGTTTASAVAVQISNLIGIKGIAAGRYHGLAVNAAGTVYAWGDNEDGALGIGNDTTDQLVPVLVQGPNGNGTLPPIAQVAGGYGLSLALTTDGRVYAWGYGSDGEIGDGLRNEDNPYPTAVRSANGPGQLGGISQVAAGNSHVVVIASATATPNPTSLAFGSLPVGTVSAVQNVTITNAGGGPLSVTGVTIGGANAGDFNLVGGCETLVPAGSSCTVGVAFKPTAIGARAGVVSFATSAGQTDVPLSGTGTAAPAGDFTVTASVVGNGTINPVGVTHYTGGTLALYTATPAAGQVFLGWTLDGTYVGYPTPFDFTVNSNRTLVATFAPRPIFSDVPTNDTDWQAITFLAAFGIVNPQGVNGSGQFQPERGVFRAEVAAFIARTFGWNTEFHRNNFPDRCDPQSANCVDSELWNNVAALADYGVVGGYTDSATCASAGTNAPCYLPRDQVIKLQVVSIVARAFTKTPDLRPTGFWDRLAAVAGQYTNVPDAGSQRSDLATYRANAGAIPGQTSDATFPAPTDAAARRFVIATLYQAFNAVYSVDRTP